MDFPSTHDGNWLIKELCFCPNFTQSLEIDGNAENMERHNRWEERDIEARSYIYWTLGSNQQAALQGCKTAPEMWS